MCIAKRKSNHSLALVLLSALVIGFTLLSSRPRLDRDSLNLSAGNISGAEEREDMERGGEPEGAAWFMSQRTYGLGYIPKDAEIRAVEDMRHRMIPELAAKGYSLKKSAAGQLNWEYLGPGNIGGRLRGLVVHPDNPNVIYAGSVSGGVWKSTNGGASWFPTMNDLITLNISALVMKPGDPNTLYAGTGEGYVTNDALPGRGILKTTDGGNTWKRVHVDQGLNSPFITAIAVSPANPNVVYAAGRQTAPQIAIIDLPAETIPDSGINAIFKSTDSGETWQDVTTGKGIEHTPNEIRDDFPTDVVASPTDAKVVYATFGLYHWGGIWKSVDGGQTWSRLINGLPDPNLPNMGYGRIKLAMAPSDPNVLYASFTYAPKKKEDTTDLISGAMLGVWKTINSGQSWTQVTTPLTSNQRNRNNGYTTALGCLGEYANAIIVHPADPNIVFVGGLDIYKSTDGGNSWSQVSMWIEPGEPGNPEGLPYVHGDHHVFAFDPSTNPPTLYNGSDGGVARSRDLGKTWEILNHDLGVTQFYTLAVHPTNPNIMLGGTQDNGTPMLQGGPVNSWSQIAGSDGWQTFFDYTDPTTIYLSTQELGMGRVVIDYTSGNLIELNRIGYTDGSNGITQRDYDKAGFFAPYELSPNNPNVLVLGTNRVLQSTNRGDSWTPISAEVDTPIVAVAIGEGNDNVIWAAAMGGKIFKTENNGANWAVVTSRNLPKRYVTDIEFDPSNLNTVYLTYSGYNTRHVFKSTDAGGSWADITNNLPDTPTNTIQVHPQNPNLLFLGTDIGVFLSEDGGQTWQPCTNGFPTVQVAAIAVNTNVNRVYAATHGRGAYSAQLSGGAAALNVDVQELSLAAKPGQTGTAQFNIANTGTAPLNFSIVALSQFAPMSIGNAGAELSNFKSADEAVQFSLQDDKAPARPLMVKAANRRIVKSQPPAVRGNDVLVLDDGNDAPNFFLGYNSSTSFYWSNVFNLAGAGFKLEQIQFYMRTESASANPVYVGVLNAAGQALVEGTLQMELAAGGEWYTVNLTSPLSFNAGESFRLVIGADGAISFPAGADSSAQVRDNSFHSGQPHSGFVNLNTVPGFKNGAFLIRAAGTKMDGGNLRPIAKVIASTLQAEVNEPITFDASKSFDPDGQIIQYLWNFGDDSTSTQKIETHAYARAGIYTVALTVTDNQGATGYVSGQITVNSATASRLTVNPASGSIAAGSAQNIAVTFDAQDLAEGNYQGQIAITSNGGNQTIPVRIRVSNNIVNVTELNYDSGTPTRGYSWPQAGQGSAVRFTPPSKPAKVTQAKIFIRNMTNGNQFNLRVLADANGIPGNTIYGPAPVTVANTGWAAFDLSAANISANGDFYVMIEYNGASRPTFGSETTPPIAKRSWDFDGQNWVLFDTEDYLIRAVVEYTTSVADHEGKTGVPARFELSQNYPNPFRSEATSRFAGNPETWIKYQLPARAQVALSIYDLNGRRVAIVESGVKETGEHVVRWNGRDNEGRRVASGVYFYRLEATSSAGTVTTLTKKMAVLK